MVSPETGEAIVILVVGFMLIQGLWLSVITYLMFRRAEKKRREEVKPGLEDTFVEEVFLLHRSGLLIRHLTRRLKPHVDSDILTGMLRAVQEFVKDSFKEERGELNEMAFGELKISICSGRYVVMAIVTRGERPVDIMDQMKTAINELEAEHGEVLKDWDGMMDSVDFVDEYLRRLLEGDYASRKRDSRLEKPMEA
jgi:OOP family OmpA-OmpF porin